MRMDKTKENPLIYMHMLYTHTHKHTITYIICYSGQIVLFDIIFISV